MRISTDRAWWLEVLVLKNQGKSSRNQKSNGPRDMEVDVVQSSLSSEACQPKDVLTKVDRQCERGLEKETAVPSCQKRFLAFHMFLRQRM